MNYATTYYIGDISSPRRKTAKKTTSAVNRVRPLDETAEGRRRSPKRQTKVCSPEPIANGFLKTTFLPRLKTQESVQDGKEMERDFYKSLSRLTEHYGIELLPMQDFEYPYNIVYAFREANNYLKENVKNFNALRLVQDSTKTYLIAEERFSTGATLYYIPVVPLWMMLKDKAEKEAAHLLLSVCSYLYHIADIPYYRQESSYLHWQYDMLKEWMEEDEDINGEERYSRQFFESEWIGDRIEKKLYSLKNLDFFENRLKKFKAIDSFQKECVELSLKTFQLYRQYPSERYSRNALADYPKLGDEEDEYDQNDIVSMDMYVSFYAHSRGRLSENLFETLNINFGEMGNTEEPTIFRSFDGNPLPDKNLDFEEQLFEIMDHLIYLLNKYYDNNHG